MKDYIIKIIHPGYGSQTDVAAQGMNAFEALENALEFGHPSKTPHLKQYRTGNL